MNEMSEEERKEFLVWNENHKSEHFDNRRDLETYSQDDVSVLKEACRLFRREFVHLDKVDFFVVSITIAFACIKFLCKRFLKPDAIGLFPTGGYSFNNR